MSRVPCLAHVIQLALTALIVDIKIQAKNNQVITEWVEAPADRQVHSVSTNRKAGAPYTLMKVCRSKLSLKQINLILLIAS